jgi:hypothetical protein
VFVHLSCWHHLLCKATCCLLRSYSEIAMSVKPIIAHSENISERVVGLNRSRQTNSLLVPISKT